VVTHGVDGYLFEPRDVNAGAKFALDILSRADHGRAMGKMARVNARARYCSNDIIPRYEAYYEKILSSAGAPALAAT